MIDLNQVRKAMGDVEKELPEKIYLKKDVKAVMLEVLKKLEEVNK